ncbi:ligase-associated DNA damage response exonuclease [Cryomorphaceae bacterium]|nr:ligase-associated DNA damage response exonuclease [Cryomorphaceae bacterium]
MPLIEFRSKGLYCPPGDFYIDPWRKVDYAVVTHAHADHARWGMKHYLAHHLSGSVLRLRLGQDISLQTVEYGEVIARNGVKISLHPAGHIIGSAQVRVEYRGEVWVISGDYKTGPDDTTTPFEPISCHHFITESTFGLPVYRWAPQNQIFEDINRWWQQNAEEGRVSLLLGYSLGKAQRLLTGVNADIGRIFTHGAVENTNLALRADGFGKLPQTEQITRDSDKSQFPGSLVVAPPSAAGSSWVKQFRPFEVGIASGWMSLRGPRRRRNVDRGFALSDHADWIGLLEAIEGTGAEHIYVTHGYTDVFAQYLNEKGYNASVVRTEYEGELAEIGEGTVKGEESA